MLLVLDTVRRVEPAIRSRHSLGAGTGISVPTMIRGMTGSVRWIWASLIVAANVSVYRIRPYLYRLSVDETLYNVGSGC